MYRIIFFLLFLTRITFGETFKVFLPDIPEVIDNKDHRTNYKFFYINQLFEPLFYYTGEGYKSRILENWNANTGFDNYQLCLRDDSYFSNGMKLTTDILINNLKSFIGNVVVKIHIESSKCLRLKFLLPYPEFVEKFSSFDYVITFTDQKGSYGISPYKITRFIPGKEILLTSIDSRLKYSSILILNFRNKQTFDGIVQEYNYLNYVDIPNNIKKDYNKYAYFHVEASYLLTNDKDKKIRDIVYNCVDQKTIHEIVYGEDTTFRVMDEFFPLGVLEKLNYKIKRKCVFNGLEKRREIRFTYFQDKQKRIQLENYFNSVLNKYNIFIKAQQVGVNEAAKMLESKEKDYGVALILHGGRSIKDYMISFTNDSEKDRIIDTIDGIYKSKTKLSNEEKMHRLIKFNYVLPLVQIKKYYYYPRNFELPKVSNNMDLNNYKVYELK
ncbi:MAG: hypothetical protein A2381_11010 [Bdellovibrionales bacterium RIFOXYB1_FULL_37_110]|nr:MAG: hypothetical protein A2181_07150 [Bdellovibrionales bacterium RIFOXYA1_FULL_38_20]OFZ51194.1 MAG: hypothetical protein A2417_17995 [Bdellovibrionales bacterium RIFOXYC1_FULL_37_79]OFZ61300.1 MAG: hypothetical protein A2381_11010 [Bdellovibrionales bacterium RIFOXYB1_FULL_37_110]OFZ62163.1 MAG: hypothetical protein A2577_14585 [Bdellovibrionales bacterium RIFOXYD1_FULL_36_51]